MQKILLIDEEKILRLERLGRVVPLKARHYVVKDPDDDYLCGIEPTGLATVEYDFHWTKDLQQALVFDYESLFNSGLMREHLITGYSGLQALRVKVVTAVKPSKPISQPVSEMESNPAGVFGVRRSHIFTPLAGGVLPTAGALPTLSRGEDHHEHEIHSPVADGNL
jgi:hypothetical protein